MNYPAKPAGMCRISPMAEAANFVIMWEASQMKMQIHQDITKRSKGMRARVHCKSLAQTTPESVTWHRMLCHMKQHSSFCCLSFFFFFNSFV